MIELPLLLIGFVLVIFIHAARGIRRGTGPGRGWRE